MQKRLSVRKCYSCTVACNDHQLPELTPTSRRGIHAESYIPFIILNNFLISLLYLVYFNVGKFAEEQHLSSLAGNLMVTEERRSASVVGSSLAAPDHLYSVWSNFESRQVGSSSRSKLPSTSTPTDGHCSDEISDSQISRMMKSLRDLTVDDDKHCSEVDALPLEATRVGRSVRCMDQTGSEAGRLQGGPKIWHNFFVRLNFIKYYPIFKIISLSESGENP